MKRFKIPMIVALFTIPIVALVVYAGTGSPTPAVGLYWLLNGDPTTAPGASAPLNQLGIRTDSPSIYYHSGSSPTAWTQLGSPGSGSGGTVTSIACGAGVTCSPSPITSTGTISLTAGSDVITGSGTPNAVSRFLTSSSIGDGGATDDLTHFSMLDEYVVAGNALEFNHFQTIDVSGTITAFDLTNGTGVLPGTVYLDTSSPFNGPVAVITGILPPPDVSDLFADTIQLTNSAQGTCPSANNSNPPCGVVQFVPNVGSNSIGTPTGKVFNLANAESIWLQWDGGQWIVVGNNATIARVEELSLEPGTYPSALAGGSSTANYNPWSSGDVTSSVYQDVSGSGTATISGLVHAGPANSQGRVVVFDNISTTHTITLTSNDVASAPANRFLLPNGSSVSIPPQGGVVLIQDTSVTGTGDFAWRVFGLAGTATITNSASVTMVPVTVDAQGDLGPSPITTSGGVFTEVAGEFDVHNGSFDTLFGFGGTDTFIRASSATTGTVHIGDGTANGTKTVTIGDATTNAEIVPPLFLGASTSSPSWNSGTTAPTGACTSGSIFSLTSATTPAFYSCANGAWVALVTGGGSISGLTAGVTPVASTSTTLTNGSTHDDGTSLTTAGLKWSTCTDSHGGGIVNLTIPDGCTFLIWSPVPSTGQLVGIAPPASGSRHVTIYATPANGGNFEVFALNANATAPSWQFDGNLSGGWLSINQVFTVDYDPVSQKWITGFSQDIGPTNVHGPFTVTAPNTATFGGDVVLAQGTDTLVVTQDALSTGTQNINMDSSGAGAVIVNGGAGSITNSGTGGFIVKSGGASPASLFTIITGLITATQEVLDSQTFSSATGQQFGFQSSLSGTFNTTGGAANAWGVFSSVTSTQGTGTNGLTNTGGYFNASGGTTNQALVADNGAVVLNKTSGNTAIGSIANSNAQYTWIDRQIFTSTTAGTYTPAAGTRMVHVRMDGGGSGGGGAGSTGIACGGGGAAGSYLEITITAASFTGGTGASGPIAGTGGAGGAGTGANGSAGGDSKITINGSLITAKGATSGGQGGAGSTSASVRTGGAGTAGSTAADINITGQNGGSCWGNGTTLGQSGIGGSNPLGFGGASISLDGNGTAATGFGAGGGGAFGQGTGGAGGAATSGIIYVDEYR